MRQLLFAFIAVLSPVLLLDRFIQWTREPHKPDDWKSAVDCADEDVPVVPDVTWYLDKDGHIHSSKVNWKK